MPLYGNSLRIAALAIAAIAVLHGGSVQCRL